MKWTHNGWTAKRVRNRQLYCERYDNVCNVVSVHVATLSIDDYHCSFEKESKYNTT